MRVDLGLCKRQRNALFCPTAVAVILFARCELSGVGVDQHTTHSDLERDTQRSSLGERARGSNGEGGAEGCTQDINTHHRCRHRTRRYVYPMAAPIYDRYREWHSCNLDPGVQTWFQFSVFRHRGATGVLVDLQVVHFFKIGDSLGFINLAAYDLPTLYFCAAFFLCIPSWISVTNFTRCPSVSLFCLCLLRDSTLCLFCKAVSYFHKPMDPSLQPVA